MATARRDRLKQELRDEILDAARSLFVRHGYESVSVRKIAEKCGCATGTLYLHFADKDAILSAICLETFAKLEKRMRAIANDTGDPLENLRRSGRQYIQFGLDHPHHYIVTFGMEPREHVKDDATKQAGRGSFDCLRNVVKKCLDAGQLRSTDFEAAVQSIWAASHGLVMLLITKPGFPFVEQTRLIETLLDITIEGVRAK